MWIVPVATIWTVLVCILLCGCVCAWFRKRVKKQERMQYLNAINAANEQRVLNASFEEPLVQPYPVQWQQAPGGFAQAPVGYMPPGQFAPGQLPQNPYYA